MIIAQISDLHVGPPGELLLGRVDTAHCLARCTRHISALPVRPDVVIASGDLVNRGTEREYQTLRGLLAALDMPVYLLPGNHDERSALRAAFPEHTYLPDSKLHYTVEVEDLRLVMLDTVVAGGDAGALDDEQLQWLERMLAADDLPVVVFMHHPPCAIGVPYMDEIALDAAHAERLAAVLMRSGRVRRICCGHVHRSIALDWAGTIVTVCPSSAFQYAADPRSDVTPAMTLEQPAYQLHTWDGARLITHTIQIPASA